jgi:hypothetical protein
VRGRTRDSSVPGDLGGLVHTQVFPMSAHLSRLLSNNRIVAIEEYIMDLSDNKIPAIEEYIIV